MGCGGGGQTVIERERHGPGGLTQGIYRIEHPELDRPRVARSDRVNAWQRLAIGAKLR
jgi:hypothetical protein